MPDGRENLGRNRRSPWGRFGFFRPKKEAQSIHDMAPAPFLAALLFILSFATVVSGGVGPLDVLRQSQLAFTTSRNSPCWSAHFRWFFVWLLAAPPLLARRHSRRLFSLNCDRGDWAACRNDGCGPLIACTERVASGSAVPGVHVVSMVGRPKLPTRRARTMGAYRLRHQRGRWRQQMMHRVFAPASYVSLQPVGDLVVRRAESRWWLTPCPTRNP